MAIIIVSNELLRQDWVKEAFFNAFDSIEELNRYEPNAKAFRVQRDEVPKEDNVICPAFYSFEGVMPFIIDFGL